MYKIVAGEKKDLVGAFEEASCRHISEIYLEKFRGPKQHDFYYDPTAAVKIDWQILLIHPYDELKKTLEGIATKATCYLEALEHKPFRAFLNAHIRSCTKIAGTGSPRSSGSFFNALARRKGSDEDTVELSTLKRFLESLKSLDFKEFTDRLLGLLDVGRYNDVFRYLEDFLQGTVFKTLFATIALDVGTDEDKMQNGVTMGGDTHNLSQYLNFTPQQKSAAEATLKDLDNPQAVEYLKEDHFNMTLPFAQTIVKISAPIERLLEMIPQTTQGGLKAEEIVANYKKMSKSGGTRARAVTTPLVSTPILGSPLNSIQRVVSESRTSDGSRLRGLSSEGRGDGLPQHFTFESRPRTLKEIGGKTQTVRSPRGQLKIDFKELAEELAAFGDLSHSDHSYEHVLTLTTASSSFLPSNKTLDSVKAHINVIGPHELKKNFNLSYPIRIPPLPRNIVQIAKELNIWATGRAKVSLVFVPAERPLISLITMVANSIKDKHKQAAGNLEGLKRSLKEDKDQKAKKEDYWTFVITPEPNLNRFLSDNGNLNDAHLPQVHRLLQKISLRELIILRGYELLNSKKWIRTPVARRLTLSSVWSRDHFTLDANFELSDSQDSTIPLMIKVQRLLPEEGGT